MSKFLKNHVQKITATKTCLNLLRKELIGSKIMYRYSWIYMLAFHRPKKFQICVKEVATRLNLRGMLELEKLT